MNNKRFSLLTTLLLPISTIALCNQHIDKSERSQSDFSKANLIEFIRQQHSNILNCEDKTQNGEVIKEYKQLAEQALNTTIEAIHTLSNPQIESLKTWFKNKILNPSKDAHEYTTKTAKAGVELGLLQDGTAITKDMIREKFSFIREFSSKNIQNPDREYTNMIIELLEKQGNSQEMINKLKEIDDTIAEFTQKNRSVIVNFLFEAMVDRLYHEFQASDSFNEDRMQNQEQAKQFANELGISNKEAQQFTYKLVESLIDGAQESTHATA